MPNILHGRVNRDCKAPKMRVDKLNTRFTFSSPFKP